MANNNYQNNNQGQDNGEARAARRDMNTFLCRCRLAADATYRPGGVDENGGQAESVLFFRLACNDGYLRRDKTNAVSYISCRLRGKRADALHQFLTKGTRVTMEARLVTWSNKDAQGQYEDHYILDVDELWFESQNQAPQNQAPQQYGQPMMGQPAMQNQQMPAAPQQYGQPMMGQPAMQNQQMANQAAPTQQQMPVQAPQQYNQSMMNQPVMQNQAPVTQQQMQNQQMPAAPQQYGQQPVMQNQAPVTQQPMMGHTPAPAAPSPFAFEENPFENPMFSVGN